MLLEAAPAAAAVCPDGKQDGQILSARPLDLKLHQELASLQLGSHRSTHQVEPPGLYEIACAVAAGRRSRGQQQQRWRAGGGCCGVHTARGQRGGAGSRPGPAVRWQLLATTGMAVAVVASQPPTLLTAASKQEAQPTHPSILADKKAAPWPEGKTNTAFAPYMPPYWPALTANPAQPAEPDLQQGKHGRQARRGGEWVLVHFTTSHQAALGCCSCGSSPVVAGAPHLSAIFIVRSTPGLVYRVVAAPGLEDEKHES